MTSWMFWRETGWPPPLLFVMVMMTQATGSPSASSLQNSGLSVTSRAPALWGGRQESLLTRWHTCPERSLMPWSTGSAARGGGGGGLTHCLRRSRSIFPLKGRSSVAKVLIGISMQLPPRNSPFALQSAMVQYIPAVQHEPELCCQQNTMRGQAHLLLSINHHGFTLRHAQEAACFMLNVSLWQVQGGTPGGVKVGVGNDALASNIKA